MKILISGYSGHMGQVVQQQAKAGGIEIAGGIDLTVPAQADVPVYASFDEAPALGDVIIDFSKPSCLDSLLAYAVKNHIPAVLATTGYDDAQLKAIDEAAKQVPIFRSANMSVGVALVRQLVRKAAEVLGDTFDIEIVETHHNRKVDAPSGTALMLYDSISQAFEQPPKIVGGRYGKNAKREKGEIGIHALRGGTVAGEHEVSFFGPMERVRISHSAEDRAVFAIGALRAADFLIGREPGLYSMDDLLA